MTAALSILSTWRCKNLQVPEGAENMPSKAAPRAAFKFNSVGSQFKKQLGELMAQLHTRASCAGEMQG